MIVNGGQQVNFTYPTYSETSGLSVGGLLYDVTSGTPSQVGSVIQMSMLESGVYEGVFTPTAGRSYLIITVVYTDNTFTTIDTTWAPGADNYDAYITDTTLLNFNYGAFDQNDSLTISATINDISDSTSSSITMGYVTAGVYFGQYTGVIGKNYSVAKVPASSSYAPGSDSFQCFTLGSSPLIVNNQYVSPTLVVTGQSSGGFVTND